MVVTCLGTLFPSGSFHICFALEARNSSFANVVGSSGPWGIRVPFLPQYVTVASPRLMHRTYGPFFHSSGTSFGCVQLSLGMHSPVHWESHCGQMGPCCGYFTAKLAITLYCSLSCFSTHLLSTTLGFCAPLRVSFFFKFRLSCCSPDRCFRPRSQPMCIFWDCEVLNYFYSSSRFSPF